MKSLDKEGRSLEEIVENLLDVKADKNIRDIKDEVFIAKVLIQKLKGEMRKYLSRSEMYSRQISYLKEKIEEIEDKFPETKIDVTPMSF